MKTRELRRPLVPNALAGDCPAPDAASLAALKEQSDTRKAKDKALGNLLETVHVVLNYTLIAVLLGHVGAALKHHFIDRDEVLTRMLPRRKG